MPSQNPYARPGRPRPPAGRALRDRAHRAVRSSAPPTVPIAVSAGGDAIDASQARAVIDLALRVGESLLSTGASASDVVATVLRLVDAYGLRSCHVDVAFTSITVSYHRGVDHDPMTVMRIVKVRSSDFTRLEKLHELVRTVSRGLLPVDVARERLDEVVTAPHPYRRWLVTIALGVLGAGVAALFGGGVVMMAVSGASAALVDRVQRWLARRRIAAFFSQAVGAAIPTLIAVLLYAAHAQGLDVAGLSPSLVVVSGIVVLLAGMSVVGAAQDAIDGYYVTAGARSFEVVILTLGIVVGIAGMLAAAHRAGVRMEISPQTQLTSNVLVWIAASMAIAGAFALSAYTGARATLFATLIAAVGAVVYLAAAELRFGPSTASAMAALAIGVLSEVASRQWSIPALAVTTAGIVPLMPGLTVYRGLFQLVENPAAELATGLTTLLGAAGIGLGLAAGVSMGTFLARPILSELDRSQQRALRRASADARE